MVEILVPLGFFVMIGFIIAALVWGAVQKQRAYTDALKSAYEAGKVAGGAQPAIR
jgi:hypothetical protein